MNDDQSKNRLDVLTELGEAVDPVIEEILNSEIPERFRELTNYQIRAGGKRLRPALLFASCYLLGGKTENAIHPAAGIEILHNYTLIVDDIIDNSRLRRGRPTVWKEFGLSTAECVGSFYAASIFQAARMSRNPIQVSEIFARTLKMIITGEIMDILCERGGKDNEPYIVQNRLPAVSKKEYLEMASNKTASLFETSCKLGGICANGREEEVELLGSYGHNLGMAFQIQDDVLDIFGDEVSFGKKIGKDVLERKGGNIVILLALEELGSRNQKELSGILTKNRILSEDVKRAVSIIGKTDAGARSKKMGEGYVLKAKRALGKLPQNRWNETLEALADFVIERNK